MKLSCQKRKALRFKVEIVGNIDEYARSFLAIYNNVKNDQDLLKMYNDYDNNVYVVCETHVRDAATDFLDQFGNIVTVEDVEIVQPIGYDYEYSDELDTEFLPVEEI